MINKSYCFANDLLEVYGEGNFIFIEDKLQTKFIIRESGKALPKLDALLDKKIAYVKSIAMANGVNKFQMKFSKKPPVIRSNHEVKHVKEIALKQHDNSRIYIGGGILTDSSTNTEFSSFGYQIVCSIAINFPNLQQKKLFLNQISHVKNMTLTTVLTPDEQKKHYQIALSKAIENASVKANELSAKLGKKVGDIVTIKELKEKTNSRNDTAYTSAFIANTKEEKTPSISASVLVKFKLID